MDISEKIYAWKPIEGLASKVHVYSICNDNEKGFQIILEEDKNTTRRVLLDFYGSVRAFRWCDDLIAFHLLESPVEDCKGPWALFTVTNSEYLHWASRGAGFDVTTLKLEHYVIWTEDSVVEVLSWAEPEVEFIGIE